MEAILKWFGELYNNVRFGIYNLKIEYGIEPAVTVALAALILIILIIIIVAMARHRKIKKKINDNADAIKETRESLHVICDSIDSLTKNVEDLDEKLGETQERLLETEEGLALQEEAARQVAKQPNYSRSGPDIIYIDNRKMSEPQKAEDEDIISNIDSAISALVESKELVKEAPKPSDFDMKITDPNNQDKQGVRAIYRDRNSGISKSGVEYTLEQLQKQIKE